MEDQVKIACEIYNEGLVNYLIMSGGLGDGGVHETEGMKQYAMSLSILEHAILRDEQVLRANSIITPSIRRT